MATWRVTQEAVEVLFKDPSADIRVTQLAVEVMFDVNVPVPVKTFPLTPLNRLKQTGGLRTFPPVV